MHLCDYCHEHTAVHVCSGCHAHYYCNAKCQTAAWTQRGHRIGCLIAAPVVKPRKKKSSTASRKRIVVDDLDAYIARVMPSAKKLSTLPAGVSVDEIVNRLPTDTAKAVYYPVMRKFVHATHQSNLIDAALATALEDAGHSDAVIVAIQDNWKKAERQMEALMVDSIKRNGATDKLEKGMPKDMSKTFMAIDLLLIPKAPESPPIDIEQMMLDMDQDRDRMRDISLDAYTHTMATAYMQRNHNTYYYDEMDHGHIDPLLLGSDAYVQANIDSGRVGAPDGWYTRFDWLTADADGVSPVGGGVKREKFDAAQPTRVAGQLSRALAERDRLLAVVADADKYVVENRDSTNQLVQHKIDAQVAKARIALNELEAINSYIVRLSPPRLTRAPLDSRKYPRQDANPMTRAYHTMLALLPGTFAKPAGDDTMAARQLLWGVKGSWRRWASTHWADYGGQVSGMVLGGVLSVVILGGGKYYIDSYFAHTQEILKNIETVIADTARDARDAKTITELAERLNARAAEYERATIAELHALHTRLKGDRASVGEVFKHLLVTRNTTDVGQQVIVRETLTHWIEKIAGRPGLTRWTDQHLRALDDNLYLMTTLEGPELDEATKGIAEHFLMLFGTKNGEVDIKEEAAYLTNALARQNSKFQGILTRLRHYKTEAGHLLDVVKAHEKATASTASSASALDHPRVTLGVKHLQPGSYALHRAAGALGITQQNSLFITLLGPAFDAMDTATRVYTRYSEDQIMRDVTGMPGVDVTWLFIGAGPNIWLTVGLTLMLNMWKLTSFLQVVSSLAGGAAAWRNKGRETSLLRMKGLLGAMRLKYLKGGPADFYADDSDDSTMSDLLVQMEDILIGVQNDTDWREDKKHATAIWRRYAVDDAISWTATAMAKTTSLMVYSSFPIAAGLVAYGLNETLGDAVGIAAAWRYKKHLMVIFGVPSAWKYAGSIGRFIWRATSRMLLTPLSRPTLFLSPVTVSGATAKAELEKAGVLQRAGEAALRLVVPARAYEKIYMGGGRLADLTPQDKLHITGETLMMLFVLYHLFQLIRPLATVFLGDACPADGQAEDADDSE